MTAVEVDRPATWAEQTGRGWFDCPDGYEVVAPSVIAPIRALRDPAPRPPTRIADLDVDELAAIDAAWCALPTRWTSQPGDPAGTARDLHGRLVDVHYGPTRITRRYLDRTSKHYRQAADVTRVLVDPGDVHVLDDGGYRCLTCERIDWAEHGTARR